MFSFCYGLFLVSFLFCFVSPEFSYRAGLPGVPDGTASVSSAGAPTGSGTGGAPNRPLPPTPDDDESQGDRTLVLRKVSQPNFCFNFSYSFIIRVAFFHVYFKFFCFLRGCFLILNKLKVIVIVVVVFVIFLVNIPTLAYYC